MNTAHMGNPTTYSYPPDGLSGILRYDSRTSTYTPYAVETDHLGSITALYNSSGTKVMGASFDAWGKRTQTTSTLEFRRGFTGHEHIDGFDLINMNGRVYDPLIGRFLSPDMYVQLPGFSQSFNRYSYCLNNPLKYNDPDGEFWETIFFDPITFGIGNTLAHCIRGDINNFGDVLCYFGQGALAGAAITTTWCLAPCVPIAGDLFQASLIGQVYFNIGAMALGMSSGIVRTIIKQNPTTLINSMELLLGNYYIDENAGFRKGVWQGYSRHTWESIQTTAGQLYSQGKNFIWNAERVDYLGGATYMTNEMSSNHDGVTLGNYISINIPGRIDKDKDFDTYVCSNPMFMHEYGHTFDSREMGPMYLFTIGIPSAKSASNSSIENGFNHDWYWTELRANRAAKKYFGRHYKVDWSQYETDVESIHYYPVVAPSQEMIEKRIDYIKRIYIK